MSGAIPVAIASRPVAAFDFDGTLLAGDTLLILHRLVRSPWGQLIDGLVLLPALLLWKSGQRSTAWFKQRVLQQLLTPAMQQRSEEQCIALLENSLANALWRQLRPQALTRLVWHRQQGHRLVIVSASPRCLLQPIAERLNVELIATETSNPCSGNAIELRSPNCKGGEKLRRLEQWLGEPPHSVELHAYGDSRGDRELLQIAAHPHWRDFGAEACPYLAAPAVNRWFGLAAGVLLVSALAGLLQLDPATQATLRSGLEGWPAWMPAIVALLVLSYAGRFARFRWLLQAQGIGHTSRREILVWFQGFALTATPGKLGELTRVQQLHQHLGYPRAPLLHAFLAERLCDAVAVLIWLVLLVPGQLQERIGGWSSATALGLGSLMLLLVAALGRLLWSRRSRWRHYLPSARLYRACLPASGLSLGLWAAEAMILWLLVQAISPTATISAGAAISIYLLSGTAGMASLLPGGLGVNEAATTLLLHQAGIPTSLALSIAILRRIFTIWLVVFASTMFLMIPYGKFNVEG
ncbi:HAD-IB family hydrolase [Synechococcus sp. MIT S9503]|uniref:HAD-IB family hydrolase n=1 Tax=Synechococcus sp. MIT S9503 TaxID=3082547 RepID=UPI0039A4DBE9